MSESSKAKTSGPPLPEPRKPEIEEEEEREEGLDRTLAESFPASDPPSSIPNPDDEEDAA